VPTDPKTMGLAGVAQVVRIHCHAQEVRQGKVVKETDDVRFAVTSYWPQEAGPQPLLDLTRDPWSIENGQHYRRDRTQDEDRCPVRDTVAARNLSLFRSLAIFLFKAPSKRKAGMRNKLCRQRTNPGVALLNANLPAWPRAPPATLKRRWPLPEESIRGAVAVITGNPPASCPPYSFRRSKDFVTTREGLRGVGQGCSLSLTL